MIRSCREYRAGSSNDRGRTSSFGGSTWKAAISRCSRRQARLQRMRSISPPNSGRDDKRIDRSLDVGLLITAVRRDDPTAAASALDAGADPDTCAEGYPLLCLAAASGHRKVLELLLRAAPVLIFSMLTWVRRPCTRPLSRAWSILPKPCLHTGPSSIYRRR